MKKKIMEIASLIMLMGLPILVATGLHAGDTSVVNTGTGSGSTNTSSVVYANVSNVVIENVAAVTNTAVVTAVTGTNTASENTGDGTVTSGNIDGSVTVADKLNVTDVTMPATTTAEAPGFVAKNSYTGANSTNLANFSSTNTQNVVALNTLRVANNAVANLSTGGNVANGNTGDGSVTSGNIKFAINFETIGNLVNIMLGGKGGGGPVPVDPPIYGGKGGGGPILAEAVEILKPLTLPVAGADDLMLMIIAAALGTVFLVETLNRKKLRRKEQNENVYNV